MFLTEFEVQEIERAIGVRRYVTDRVRQFWREFKPKSVKWSKTQQLLDQDNREMESSIQDDWLGEQTEDTQKVDTLHEIMKVYDALVL